MTAIAEDYWTDNGKGGSAAIFYNTPPSEFERNCVLEVYPQENSEEQIKENVGFLRALSMASNW